MTWRIVRSFRLFKVIRIRTLFPITDQGTRYMDLPYVTFYF